ncbi:TonB-dependent receptor [Paraburkholderia pallida]|uniref:TonB-dependent receptor n=2 Tax=Paraburkholderia pallida TaxID=2547399 RepID=A0A4V1AZN3_9BURK|nr:TonB-dependent receptor [Paraburkholderia pallida]
MAKMKNKPKHTAVSKALALRHSGRYATLFVGPVFGLASLGAHAQQQTTVQAQAQQIAAPEAASAAKPAPGAPAAGTPAAASGATAANAAAAETSKIQGKDGATLNTVVVTATRRREPAREVPMQVNVLSADELQKSGAQTMSDYLSSEPGVDLNASGGSGSGQVSIRGVTTGVQTGPTVGIYIDDVAFGGSTLFSQSATFALDMSLLDLNHVEILRGPQGTLYGAGAMGGLLKYVTNEPDPGQFYGQVGAGVSGTEHGGVSGTANATLNVPLKTDVAALRVSVFGQHDGGYVDSVGPLVDTHIDRSDTYGARASLLLTPTRDLTVRLSAVSQNINRNAPDYVEYGANGQPVWGDLTTQQFAPQPFHQNIQLYSAGIEYELGWARLNSITSFQRVNTSAPQDLTGVYGPLFAAQGLDLGSVVAADVATTNKFTQEFRLTSPGNQRLEWLAGLFYTHERSTLNEGFLTTLPDGTVGPNLSEIDAPSTYDEYAAYGDLTYHLTSRLALTAGIRIAHNTQTYEQTTFGTLAGPTQTVSAPSSDTSKTYMFTARYALTPNSNAYVRVASGYRPGGPNALLIDPLTGMRASGSPTFDPDTLWSYEAGYKADLLDKRLSLEASVYDIEWKNIQQLGTVDGVNQVVNAGDARIKGLEFSGTFRPDRHWNFSANLSLIDAHLTTGSASAGTTAGEPLPNSAKVAATLSGTYLFTVDGHPSYAGVIQRFVGRRHSGFDASSGRPDYPLPGYAITDLQAGVDFGKCSLAFYVRNLFDRRALMAAGTSLIPLGGPALVSVIQPRTIGATLNIPF